MKILYYRKSEKYLVQTWSQTKSSTIQLVECDGVTKKLDPNKQPEKQNIRPLKMKFHKRSQG